MHGVIVVGQSSHILLHIYSPCCCLILVVLADAKEGYCISHLNTYE